jgi:hypothetical protein
MGDDHFENFACGLDEQQRPFPSARRFAATLTLQLLNIRNCSPHDVASSLG